MRRALAIVLLSAGALSEGRAHRLDECLQAIRVKLAADRVDLAIEVTPGAVVAREFLAVLDADRSGVFSADELLACGESLLKDLIVRFDGQPLTFGVSEVSASPVTELRQGTGVVRIQARSPLVPLTAGDHRLILTNGHLPAISVYQVNAIKPADPAISIGKQIRNDLQTAYEVRFEVRRAEEQDGDRVRTPDARRRPERLEWCGGRMGWRG